MSVAVTGSTSLGSAGAIIDFANFDSARQYFFFVGGSGIQYVINLSTFTRYQLYSTSNYYFGVLAQGTQCYFLSYCTNATKNVVRINYSNITGLVSTIIYADSISESWFYRDSDDSLLQIRSGALLKLSSVSTASTASLTTLVSSGMSGSIIAGNKAFGYNNTTKVITIIDFTNDLSPPVTQTYTSTATLTNLRVYAKHTNNNWVFVASNQGMQACNINNPGNGWRTISGTAATSAQAIANDTVNGRLLFGTNGNAVNASGNDPFSQLVVTPSVSGSNITLSVTGGYSTRTYLWSTGATTSGLTGVADGTYSVTVTDAIGATASASAVVFVGVAIDLSYTSTNVSVYGQSTGAIDISVSGGIGTYTYQWSDGSSTTQDRTSLTAGSYTVTVTSGSYSASQTIVITQPPATSPPEITYSITNCSSYGSSDGAIDVSINQGASPFSYAWTGSSVTTQDRTGLPAGSYSLTVTDAISRTDTATIVVTQPSPITLLNTPVAVKVSWYPVASAVYYKVTYQASGGSEIISATARTTTSVLVSGLSAVTSYTIRVYSSVLGTSYALAYSRSFTTPIFSTESFDKTALATTVSSSSGNTTVYTLSSLNAATLSSVKDIITTVLDTGEKVAITAKLGNSTRSLEATVVKLGASVSVPYTTSTAVDISQKAIYMPFTSTGGAGQSASLVFPDASSVAVAYNVGNSTIVVDGINYGVGNVFIMGGKKVTVMEV